MEGDSFSMAEYRAELDSGMENVMPDTWEGHTRLALAEIADGLSEREYQFAQRLATRIHEAGNAEEQARQAKAATIKKLR